MGQGFAELNSKVPFELLDLCVSVSFQREVDLFEGAEIGGLESG